MFQGHPKGLYVAFLTNMGERFGFYTMMGILVLFLQAKFGLSAQNAGWIFSTFYFLIYALALVGGYIADRTQNYKGVVATGVVIMFVGYALLSFPTKPGTGLALALLGLGTIAFGNGLFKGNLQAIVGQMYDAPEYSKLRDSAYSIFYMGINIGAMFAPNAANAIHTWWLRKNFPDGAFSYHPELPALCHQQLNGTLTADTTARFTELAQGVMRKSAELVQGVTDTVSEITEATVAASAELAEGVVATMNGLSGGATFTPGELATFAENYLGVFNKGYHYAFGIAGIAMVISLISYLTLKQHLPERSKAEGGAKADVPEMSKEEEKQRLKALGMVFLVVIFFWMAFHQNGLTMTFFARDYTATSVGPWNYLLFYIWSLLSIGLTVTGLVLLLKPSSDSKTRAIGGGLAVVFGAIVYYFFNKFNQGDTTHSITPVIFQQFNAFFVVFLTPVVVGAFAWLRARGKEPSTPRKIGIGMIIATMGFLILLVGSLKLGTPQVVDGQPVGALAADRVSTQWLVQAYLVLTFAELFLSPMGLSFVSKVAPPRLQGLMQGGWLGATAIGNKLVLVGALVWTTVPVWATWSIFIGCMIAATILMFAMLKFLERVTN